MCPLPALIALQALPAYGFAKLMFVQEAVVTRVQHLRANLSFEISFLPCLFMAGLLQLSAVSPPFSQILILACSGTGMPAQ